MLNWMQIKERYETSDDYEQCSSFIKFEITILAQFDLVTGARCVV